MQDYYIPDWWYEPESNRHEQYVHENDLPDLAHARDHMQGILDIVYGDSSIDQFENHLEEICYILNMKIPMTAPKLVKGVNYA